MEYNIELPEFEGPLDLLLHLIKQDNISIFDISIDKITKQYLDYIHKMEELNLNIASEYLVMASDLLQIKSKTLLPKKDNEEDEEDPREELINRLINYQNYKDSIEKLRSYEALRKEVYTKEPTLEEYKSDEHDNSLNITLDDLVNALQKYYQRKEDTKPLNTKVTVNEISVSSRRSDIKKLLKTKKRVSFFELFPVASKEYIVATFLAILEMAKSKELVIKQEKEFADIICEVV